MEKDKILEKSRMENKNQDEMEKAIRIEGESFSLLFTLMAGLAVVVFMIMFWTSCASSRLYRLAKRRDMSDLITMIISLVILVFYVVKYFSQGW